MDSQTTILHLVRHGETTDSEGRCIGQTDVALSDAGRRDVRRLAASWPEDVPAPARIESSDLRRAADSARILAATLDIDASDVSTDARLREMDFGAWDGRTWDAIERDDATRLTAWMEDWVTTSAPGGECFCDVVDRTTVWLDDVGVPPPDATPSDATASDVRASEPTASIVVATHAGAIRALVCHVLGMPLDRAFRVDVDTASVTTLRATPQGWTVVALNARAFPGRGAAVTR